MDHIHEWAILISFLMTVWCLFEYDGAKAGSRDGWIFAIIGWGSFCLLEMFN